MKQFIYVLLAVVIVLMTGCSDAQPVSDTPAPTPPPASSALTPIPPPAPIQTPASNISAPMPPPTVTSPEAIPNEIPETSKNSDDDESGFNDSTASRLKEYLSQPQVPAHVGEWLEAQQDRLGFSFSDPSSVREYNKGIINSINEKTSQDITERGICELIIRELDMINELNERAEHELSGYNLKAWEAVMSFALSNKSMQEVNFPELKTIPSQLGDRYAHWLYSGGSYDLTFEDLVSDNIGSANNMSTACFHALLFQGIFALDYQNTEIILLFKEREDYINGDGINTSYTAEILIGDTNCAVYFTISDDELVLVDMSKRY